MQKSLDPIIENAAIVWQENGAPYSSRFDDIYFSRQGGLAETEHVFIAANQLPERWRHLDAQLAQLEFKRGDALQNVFTVAELGFGTGLNFLCCWRAWHALRPAKLRLHYIACEKYPMAAAALQQALSNWPELQQFSASLIQAYSDHSPGYQRLHLVSQNGTSEITLDLYYGDAAETLPAQPSREHVKIDAWFLDGFAPRVNPDMWSPQLLSTLAGLSRPGTTLSTYSVAGQVVRTLQACGFQVSKQPGFGQKRHMLHGEFTTAAQAPDVTQNRKTQTFSWLRIPEHRSSAKQAVVIGGGLAGCSAAHALARRGYRVTILEQQGDIAAGASGNRQAVLQCRLNNAVNAGWQFNLQAFLHSARHFADMQEKFPQIEWHPCGVLNLDTAFSSRRKRCAEVRLDLYSEQVVRRVSQAEAAALSGMEIDNGGNFLALGGWLNPAALCRAYVSSPLINVIHNVEAENLQYTDGGWQIFAKNQQVPVAVTDTLIVANSYAVRRFAQTTALPLVALRGQVSYVQASALSRSMSCVVCGVSYMSPAHNSLHSAGASYSKDISDLTLSAQEHEENIAGICEHFPHGAVTQELVAGGRVSVRGGTGDRMPIVGAVPDFSSLRELYNSLGHRDHKNPPLQPRYHQGLYVSVGHGSHGVSNCPLAAEYLASIIDNAPSPLQQSLSECVHPARFLLRELRKQNVRP